MSVESAPASLRVLLGRWVEGEFAQRIVIGLIVLNGISLGLETWPPAVAAAGPLLVAFDRAVLAVFVFEIAAKLAYRGLGFFRSGWNVFDFVIVGIALVPASGPFAVMRALRILRVLRLLSAVPTMRRVVSALLAAIPGLSAVARSTSVLLVGPCCHQVFARPSPTGSQRRGSITPGPEHDTGKCRWIVRP